MAGGGLHELVGKARDVDITPQDILGAINPEMSLEEQGRLSAWAKEFKFWEDYGKIYPYIEETPFYKELVETISEFIESKSGGTWLDAGCGPVKMSQIIWQKTKGEIKKIIATDIVLKPAQRKLETLRRTGNSIPLELRYANLGERLPFPDDFFDGIVANLCLTYVIDFQGKKGKAAFIEVMREMFRVLKPGSHIVWSTPKKNPFFWRNFLAALPTMFSIKKQIKYRVFGLWIGVRILKYGLGIASKGRKGIYTFLDPREYEIILRKIGFNDFEWRKTFAKQVWVNKAYKP